MTLRTKLREELSARLIPELQRRGFIGPARIMGNQLLHSFKRRRGAMHEVLEIQFEKSGLPRFVVNLSLEPVEGAAHIVESGGTIVAARATPRPGKFTRNWFRADPSLFARLTGARSRESAAVSEVLAMLDEFESWWSQPKPTNRIVDLTVSYPGQNAV